MKVVGHGWHEGDFEARFVPLVHKMIEDRGWIANSFAQVEYLAADLIVKARRFPDYDAVLRGPVDFGISNRVLRLGKLCENGPLAPHADTIMPLMQRMLELEETRHFFTHGFMSVHISKDGTAMGMHLRRYVQPRKGELETRAELFVTPESLAQASFVWIVFAQTALGLIREVYAALGLEAHDVTEGSPTILP